MKSKRVVKRERCLYWDRSYWIGVNGDGDDTICSFDSSVGALPRKEIVKEIRQDGVIRRRGVGGKVERSQIIKIDNKKVGEQRSLIEDAADE